MTSNTHTSAPANSAQETLLAIGNEQLSGIRRDFDKLDSIMDQLHGAVDDRAGRRVSTLQQQMREFEAVVTVVGQVKAGKTAIINVLAGAPGLLPSDVNPWTSVVTTLHLNAAREKNLRASFKFFDKNEWSRLIRGGGRLGEMAQRAGASEEYDAIERQVLEVRSKSMERLGKNFELLLGQRHQYDYFDTPLIERYVCMGDPNDPEITENKQGRFADITRSADIYLDLPQYSVPLAFQDTPGVNDPFLMREQITLHSVRQSEICVVVLSANQALSTVDLGLIRLLSTLDKRQVIIFVNRIDELEEPSTQVPEIRAALEATLTKHGIGGAADIVFGSALWAETALLNNLDSLPESSQHALFDWASVASSEEVDPQEDTISFTWRQSGIPSLLAAVGSRVAEGSAKRLIDKTQKQLSDLVAQTHAGNFVATDDSGQVASARLSAEEIAKRHKTLSSQMLAELDKSTTTIVNELLSKMGKANASFVQSTIADLEKHIALHGAEGRWECDPMQLRMQLRAAYLFFARSTRALAATTFAQATKDMQGLYVDMLGDPAKDLHFSTPTMPQVPPPVAIGKTIVVDLQSSWWRKWFQKRRSAQSFADEYRELIAAETSSIVKDIEEQQANSVNESMRLLLSEFFENHREALGEIARKGSADTNDLRAAPLSEKIHEQLATLESVARALATEGDDNQVRAAL